MLQKFAPGPKHRHILGNLPERRKDPLGFFMELSKYPGIARFRLGFIHVTLVFEPDYVKRILLENHGNYKKGLGYDKLAQLLGMGLFTNEGESWLRQRRLAQPAFHHQRIASFAETMGQLSQAMVDRWQKRYSDGVSFDINKEMMAITMSIVGRTLLSTDVTNDVDNVGNSLSIALEEINRRILSFSLPFPILDKLLTDRKEQAVRARGEAS
jgi:cytochrome P450